MYTICIFIIIAVSSDLTQGNDELHVPSKEDSFNRTDRLLTNDPQYNNTHSADHALALDLQQMNARISALESANQNIEQQLRKDLADQRLLNQALSANLSQLTTLGKSVFHLALDNLLRGFTFHNNFCSLLLHTGP